MICPKCKIVGFGTHCKYCGEKLVEETEHPDTKSDFLDHDTAPITPIRQNTRDEKYRDDVYDLNKAADSEYYNTDKDISGYSYLDDEKKDNKKVLIGVLTASVVVLLILSFLLTRAFISPKTKEPTSESTQNTEKKSEADDLYETAEKYMKIDDYENAEKIYLKLTQLTDDDEALLMYNILHNYNEALRKYEDADYNTARDYYKKIPVEYIDYNISEKIKKLGDNIENGIKAYEVFENIQKYMEDEDFDAAKEAISLIEVKYLSKTDSRKLDEIKAELKKASEDKKEFTAPEAESFLQEYCYAMEKAVNAGDFSLVSKYLDASAYLSQKDVVSYCSSEGIVKKFGSLRIKSFNEVESNKWEALVSETETVTFEDGTEEIRSYSRTYTIEYINSAYYIIAINGD